MSNDSERYNGWTNVFTWLVPLWLGNDEGSDSHVNDELIPDAIEEAKQDKLTSKWGDLFTVRERSVTILADKLKDEIEEGASEITDKSDLYSDLLGHAIAQVNWREIAENYLSDCDESDFLMDDCDEDEEE
jgi:hypothetical protein